MLKRQGLNAHLPLNLVTAPRDISLQSLAFWGLIILICKQRWDVETYWGWDNPFFKNK